MSKLPTAGGEAMSGVTRYEFEVDDRYLCDCGNGSRIIPVAIDTGEYVLASDYDRDTQALISELAALKAGQGEAVATVSWRQPSCEWALNMLCEIAIGEGVDVPLYLAPPASSDAVSVPAAMPERWEDRLSRMHQTIQAGCWPKRWVDDAKDYELGELRALLARSE